MCTHTSSTTDLGSLFQCLPTLTVSKVLPIFKQNALYFNLCTTKESLAPFSLLPPINYQYQAQQNSYSRRSVCTCLLRSPPRKRQ